ncbi:cystin-1 [Elgaria multicarinata webbii]|uniref:cystin-1 n=1 Tax=Elgaria multicarinata webbii TaxID=159646 RepID=UPI002FCCC074
MGTGSSRAGKARSRSSAARRWRGPARGSGSSSAPAGQGKPGEEAAAAAAVGARCSSHQTPAHLTSPSLGEPDSDSELLDQMLQECNDDGRLELPRRRPRRLDAGDSCSCPAGGSAEEDGSSSHRDQEVFLARPTQESNNLVNQLPLKKPERQAKISYDYSEEELMATIEQEYCR